MLTDNILFLDGEAIIIDKPSGLAVDPPRNGGMSLQNHLSLLTFGFKRWPTAVHRLDRDTSGCLLLARNPKAHARFQQAFEAGRVRKRYLAVIEGEPAEDSGTVYLPLVKISSAEEGWRMTGARNGKPSTTHWRVIERRDGRSFVEFIPATGRTHQIRVHALEGLGFPIVGDKVYGRAAPAMLLHSAELSVERDGKLPAAGVAPLPPSFAAAGFVLPDSEAQAEPAVVAAPAPTDG